MNDCFFIPKKNITSATICVNCGQEKMFHTIGEGICAIANFTVMIEETKTEKLFWASNFNNWGYVYTQSHILFSKYYIYIEKSVKQKWCFKFQPKGRALIICSHYEKEAGARLMIQQLIKLAKYVKN